VNSDAISGIVRPVVHPELVDRHYSIAG
jgi:hypothetical protein